MTIHSVERTNSFPTILPLSGILLVSMVATGCATSKDVDALRAEINDQVVSIRSDTAKTRQGVEAVKVDAAQTRRDVDAVKADVAQVKALGATVSSLKNRLDSVQSTVQGLQTESGAQRTTLMHQLQLDVMLARERIKQAEELLDQLQKAALAARQEGGQTRN